MKKIIIILLIICGIFFILYQQADKKNRSTERLTDLPWMVTINPDGSSTVFSQTLGKSTLNDFQTHVKRQPQISLFRDQDTSFSLEAMFEKIDLSGIISTVILELDLTEKELKVLEKSALRRKVMPSGSYQLTLSNEVIATLSNKIVKSLSYTPTSVRLDAEMIKLRFGEPAEIIKIDEEISHFIYPPLGLGIILNLRKRGKEVFQYLNPADFDRLKEKLYGKPLKITD